MSLTVHCANCSIRLTLGDDRAGQRLDCPKCEAVIQVPQSTRPTRDQDSPPLPPPLPRTRPSSPKRYRLALAALVLLALGLVSIWLVVGRDGGSNTANKEMRHSDLSELVLELNKLPDVEVTSVFNFNKALTAGILPPDREYPTVWLTITDKRDPSQQYAIHVTDCTTSDRADLVRDRRKGTLDTTPPELLGPFGYLLGNTVCSSGRFVVVGDEPAITWLRRHYKLK